MNKRLLRVAMVATGGVGVIEGPGLGSRMVPLP